MGPFEAMFLGLTHAQADEVSSFLLRYGNLLREDDSDGFVAACRGRLVRIVESTGKAPEGLAYDIAKTAEELYELLDQELYNILETEDTNGFITQVAQGGVTVREVMRAGSGF